jgi:hypothetical protein
MPGMLTAEQMRELERARGPEFDRLFLTLMIPRIGLRAGLLDAGEAIWNLRVLSKTPPPREFVGVTNSDLAFTGNYAIQGNYNGFQIWDISNPRAPTLVNAATSARRRRATSRSTATCSSSRARGWRAARLRHAGRAEAVSAERLRGIRIFDISDIRNPRTSATCRRAAARTRTRCSRTRAIARTSTSTSPARRRCGRRRSCPAARAPPDRGSELRAVPHRGDPVPLANPEQAAIVSSPRIFEGLVAPPRHGLAPEDLAAIEAARARGEFVVEIMGEDMVLPSSSPRPMLDSIVQRARRHRRADRRRQRALREQLPASSRG